MVILVELPKNVLMPATAASASITPASTDASLKKMLLIALQTSCPQLAVMLAKQVKNVLKPGTANSVLITLANIDAFLKNLYQRK